MDLRNPPGFKPRVSLMISTCLRDAKWLVHCLQSIHKFANKFHELIVVVPQSEIDEVSRGFVNPMRERMNIFPSVFYHAEQTRKGMIEHMISMGRAVDYCGGDYVAHLDADTVFKGPCNPEDLFINGKPYYIYRTYDSLLQCQGSEPGQTVISDCFQWKMPTEIQLGFKVENYTMCRFPFVFPKGFYNPYRDHIRKVHNCDYEKWMRKGKNEFPQDRMDFTAMGAFAFKEMHDKFTWINADTEPYPPDPMKAYWSHGGITETIEKELKELLT